MKLRDIIEDFLTKKGDTDFYESSVIAYRRKLNIFYEYLTNECGVNDNNYRDLLKGLSKENIIQSIEYYVDKYSIEFKVTVESYVIVIKSFFDFLTLEYDIVNDNFDSTKSFNILKTRINTKIDELELYKSKQKSPISSKAFQKILVYCDNKIDSAYESKLIDYSKKNNSILTEFISSLIVKLIMYTGIKNNIVSSISFEDYNLELNKININGYWIHVPDKLGIQMKKYIYIRDKLLGSKYRKELFINGKTKESLGKNYSYMFRVLKSVLGDNKAESVSKYTIITMIDNGMNPSIIMDFTSCSFETYMHCQEILKEQREVKIKVNDSRYLDSKLRGMENFDIL